MMEGLLQQSQQQGVDYFLEKKVEIMINMSVNKAMAEIANGPERPVPLHLRDASCDGEALGHGKGYKYPHDFPGHFVRQEYMPEPKRFYKPTEQGFEAEIAKRMKRLAEGNKE